MASDFFDSELVVATYDLLTEQANRQIAGDVTFYRECAEQFGAPVLELGVGTGRIAWALAEAGHQVVGLDRSKGMLAEATRKGMAQTVEVRERLDLRETDITSFDLARRFPLVLIPFTTFQHLTAPDQQRACLLATHRHLVQGGRLVVDVFDPVLDACVAGAETPNPEREARDPKTGHTLRRRSVARANDPFSQTFKETFRLERLDASGNLLASDSATHHLRWATRQEMIYLFEVAGFEVEACFSDFQRSEPTYGARQIWIVRAV